MRIVTRGDFDGMTACVLLSCVEKIDDVRFVHPKDVQDGKAAADAGDIVVNLPYIPGCGLWFDHHAYRDGRQPAPGTFNGRFEIAPSCARVIANHYAGRADAFAPYADLIAETDRLDSGQLTPDDVDHPQGYILLGVTLDPRSGLNAEFRDYFKWMVDHVRTDPLDALMAAPEVKTRVDRVLAEQAAFRATLAAHSRVEDGVAFVDFRPLAARPVGNRFLVYTLYPECFVELRVFKGMPGTTVAAVGHSLFNRACNVPAGTLCARYGGGGHKGAGTCQFPDADAPRIVAELLDALKRNAPPDDAP